MRKALRIITSPFVFCLFCFALCIFPGVVTFIGGFGQIVYCAILKPSSKEFTVAERKSECLEGLILMFAPIVGGISAAAQWIIEGKISTE